MKRKVEAYRLEITLFILYTTLGSLLFYLIFII